MQEVFYWVGLLAWIAIPTCIVLTDILPAVMASRSKVCDITAHTKEVGDYAVLVPIYGNIKYLENVEYLSQYGSKVVLCTTTDEDDEFNAAIAAIADERGFQLFMTEVPGRKTERGKRAVAAPIRDKVICDALGEVDATYVVCIDADTETEQSLSLLVGGFVESGMDVASVRLLPSNASTNLLTRLQDHEYYMAMRMRRLYPWLVSGACHVARTAVHREVMKHHTLFFQGNDVEFGILADTMGYDVGHIPFDVSTTVPDKWQPWLRQRYAWTGGEFRVYLVNARFAKRQPFFYFYGIIVVFVTSPLRWWTLLHANEVLLLVFVSYVLALVIFHRKRLDIYVVLVPFYQMISTLLLVPLGFWSYGSMAVKHKNWGVMRPGRPRLRARTEGGVHWSGAPIFVRSVKQLQTDLVAVGLDPGRLDGEFGHRTHAALLAWQTELIALGHDLGPAGADGVFGELTAVGSRDEAVWRGVADESVPTDAWIEAFSRRRELFAVPA